MDPRYVPLLQLPSAFEDAPLEGSRPVPFSRKRQQNVLFPWATHKPITRDMQESVMAKLIASGCKKKRRKKKYCGSAPSDLDLLIREEKRLPGPGTYHIREESSIKSIRNVKMGRLDLSSTVSLSPPTSPGPGSYNTHLVRCGLDLNKPVSFPLTGRKGMANDNKVPGPGAYPGLFERPFTPGGTMCPLPRQSRVPRVDDFDGVEPGPGWYEVAGLPPTPGGKMVESLRENDFDRAMKLADEPGPAHYDKDRSSQYMEATDRTATIPNSRPLTALERTILEGSRRPGPADYSPQRLFKDPSACFGTPVGEGGFDSGSFVHIAERHGRSTPAPNEYSPQRILHDPSAHFGVPLREGGFDQGSFVHIAERHGRSVPSPGAYELPGFGQVSLGGQFQAGKRQDILTNLNGVPGPGTYTLPNTCLKQNNPMPKFGSTLARMVYPNGLPGPAEYSVPSMDAGSRSLGRGTRPPLGSSSLRPSLNAALGSSIANPGPGAYDVAGNMRTEFFGWGSMASTVSKFDPDFEATLRTAAREPGPLDYGNTSSTLSVGGGRFGRAYDPTRPWDDDASEMSYED